MAFDNLKDYTPAERLAALAGRPYAQGKGGICLPPSLVGNQRALVTPSARVPVIFAYDLATNSLVLARTKLTIGTVGIGQSGTALGWNTSSLSSSETNFDQDGIINQECPFFSDGVMVSVEQGFSIGATVTLGSGAVKNSGTGTGDSAVVLPSTANLANWDEFTAPAVQQYFSNTELVYKAQSESCEYLTGTLAQNPSSLGFLDSGLPSNGNPIKGSYQSYPSAVIQWPTGARTKSLTMEFRTNNAFAVPFDTTAATNALPSGFGALADGDFVFFVLRITIPGRYQLGNESYLVNGQAPDPAAAAILSMLDEINANRAAMNLPPIAK